jgi:hypothetical protein
MNKKYIKIEITKEIFEDIIVTALEGGSNYWYLLKDNLPKNKDNEPLSIRISNMLWDNIEYKLPVYDIENEDELLGYLSQESLINTLQQNPEKLSCFLEGNYDADDADYIFQIAIMGEVVFG